MEREIYPQAERPRTAFEPALPGWRGGVTVAAGYGRTSTGWVAAALPALGLAVFGASG